MPTLRQNSWRSRLRRGVIEACQNLSVAAVLASSKVLPTSSPALRVLSETFQQRETETFAVGAANKMRTLTQVAVHKTVRQRQLERRCHAAAGYFLQPHGCCQARDCSEQNLQDPNVGQLVPATQACRGNSPMAMFGDKHDSVVQA